MLEEPKDFPEFNRYKIGDRIREFRVSHNLTQEQVAERADISVNFLSEIENGKKGFSSETLFHFCKKNEVSADFILFGEEPKKKNFTTIVEIANTLSDHELAILIKYLNSLADLRKI